MENRVGQRELSLDELRILNGNEGYPVDFVRRFEYVLLKLPLPENSQPGQYSAESEHGIFSERLINAVKLYQKDNGLVPDGWLGRKTLKSLRESYPEILNEPFTNQGENYLIGREIIPNNASDIDLYMFYKKLALKRFGAFTEESGKINIIGIRGMKNGIHVKNTFKEFNDTISVIWIDNSNKKRVVNFLSSVDPGELAPGKRPNPKGFATVMEGSYIYYLGDHPGSSKTLKALRQYQESHPEESQLVTIKDNNRYDALNPLLNPWIYRDIDYDGNIREGEMKEYRGNYGINIHYSHQSVPYSEGCQVVSGADNYFKFIGIIKSSTNKNAIPYTVVDVSKVEALK